MIKDPQREIINAITNILNTDFDAEVEGSFKFQAGYLMYEGENKDINGIKQNKFSFITNDPDNKFNVIEQDYIPTSFNGFIGSVEPISSVYDETSNLTVGFALKVDENFLARYEELEKLKRNLAGYSGSYIEDEGGEDERTFSYVLSTKTISQDQAPIVLDGVRVVIVNVPVAYRVFDSRAGNANSYRIRKLSVVEGTFGFVDLLQTTRNMSIGSDLDPSQANAVSQATFNKRSTVFKANMTIYDTDNLFTDELYDLIRDETTKGTDVYIFEMTIGGNVAVERNVILQNISYQDSIGTPVQWSFDLAPASELLVTQQTP